MESLEYYIAKLFFRLIRDYSIFFFVGDVAYYVNDICIDSECKEITLQYVERIDGDDV